MVQPAHAADDAGLDRRDLFRAAWLASSNANAVPARRPLRPPQIHAPHRRRKLGLHRRFNDQIGQTAQFVRDFVA